MTAALQDDIAAIAIGRNEGARLERCLASLAPQVSRMVYVDSGSTDGSRDAARALGAEVVELDTSVPFTAARARNAGFARLCEAGMPEYVQFVDGDCELNPDWIATARAAMGANPQLGVTCGRRRERHPEASVYNRMIDDEWNTPVGPARACGGDALMRGAAIAGVDGYDPTLIAGEEPELCLRLARAGWTIERLDAEMTLHDAALTRFSQWWRRTRRAGHAFAEGWAMYGRDPERHYTAEMRRILVWAVVLPLGIGLLALLVSPWALLGVLIYPLQVLRLGPKVGWGNAFFMTLGKFAEARGAADYLKRRLTGEPKELIEYK
jgi:GT2 family glycosyltransferase